MTTLLLVAAAFSAEPAPAPAAAPEVVEPTAAPALPTAEELLALPDLAARKARLIPVITGEDYAAGAKASAVAAVLGELDRAGRTDPAVVRGFVDAAMSDDGALRDAAVQAAKSGGLPPSPMLAAPAPAPAPLAAPPSLDSLQQYKAQRLYKGTLSVTTGYVSGTGGFVTGNVSSAQNWTVYQDSRALRPKEFATMVDDPAGLDRIRKSAQTTAGVSLGFLAAGVLGLAGGVALVTNDSDGDDVTGAILAAGVAPIGLGVSLGLPLGMAMRAQWVASFYEPADAERLIRGHNGEVREELGLTEQDVLAIETGT